MDDRFDRVRARARAPGARRRASPAPCRRAAPGAPWRATSLVDGSRARRRTSGLMPNSLRNSSGIERILLVALDNLGDLVFTSALTPPLRDAFPNARIDVW